MLQGYVKMLERFLSSVVASATLSTLALAALAFLLREWITERLKNSIKHEYDLDIERYKSMLTRIHNATAEGQKAAIERRMKGFDRVWKAMLVLRTEIGAYSLQFDIRTESEWRDLPNSPKFRNLIDVLTDPIIIELMGDKTIEEERPYVGETVWALFFVYRAFHIRIIHLARESLSNPERINWLSDQPTRGLLSAILSSEEMTELDNIQISKIQFIGRIIDEKLLSAWHRLISGAELGEEAMRNGSALLAAINRADQSS
jgi:hypothetical protein